MERPIFERYVDWNGAYKSQCSEPKLRKWLLARLPCEITEINNNKIDLRDIGDTVEGYWSSYFSLENDTSHYFFETSTDAMAFKLRWI